MPIPAVFSSGFFGPGTFASSASGSVDVGSDSNPLIVVFAAVDDGPPADVTAIAATYKGVALTAIGSSVHRYGVANGLYQAFFLAGSANLGTGPGTLAVTFSAGDRRPIVGWTVIHGANAVIPLTAPATSAQTGASQTVSVASNADAIALALVVTDQSGSATTPTGGTVNRHSSLIGALRFEVWEKAGASTSTLTATQGSGNAAARIVFSANAATAAATGTTLSGPSAGSVAAASTNFSVGVTPTGSTISGTLTVTPSDGGGGGSFAPTSVGLTTASPSATFTYTPASAGAKTISIADDGGLTDAASLTYTAIGVLSSPTISNVGATTAIAAFNTTAMTGTAYFLRRTSLSAASAATIISTGESQAISGSNPQSRDMTGFASGLTYYVDMAKSGSAEVVTAGPFFPGTGRTVSDVSTAGWAASAGSNFAALLDEDTASDTDYITSPALSSTASVITFALDKAYTAGTYSMKIRASVDTGSGTLRVKLLDGSGAQQGVTADQAINSTLSTFTLPITTIGTATRVSVEVTT